MKTIKVKIDGVTPLLMNRFIIDPDANGTSSAIKSNGGRTPREQAQPKLYTNESGDIVLPQPNLFKCIIEAGTYFKSGKSKLTTMKSSLIPAFVFIPGLEFPIIHTKPWEVHTCGVVIQSTGGRIINHRPRLDEWSVEFEIELDVEGIDPKLMREIVDAAGKRIGLGDFRPSRKGPYGRFVVTSWTMD